MQQLDRLKEIRNPIEILKINKTQSYAWGCKSKQCWVGKMTQQNLSTYAQLWMGIHPNGQSKITNQMSLKDYLQTNNEKNLQFLFKILSIQKCLSIQVHPNQQEAEQLNKVYPQMYVDNKDKPEMFLTLSQNFQLFLGFIGEKELQDLILIEPFIKLNQSIQQATYEQKILKLLEILVNLNQNQLKTNVNILFQNIHKIEQKRKNVLEILFNQFKYDSGILVSFLLQYHTLPKWSCFFIQAGVPHAYVKGECFQLMKNSDNVVRLGLTPKVKDISNLLKIVRNNFNKKPHKVNCIEQNNIKTYQWHSYSIKQIVLVDNQVQIKIQDNSIGILVQGQIQIRSHQQISFKQSLLSKNVLIIKKGVYYLKGQGNIFIASKF